MGGHLMMLCVGGGGGLLRVWVVRTRGSPFELGDGVN